MSKKFVLAVFAGVFLSSAAAAPADPGVRFIVTQSKPAAVTVSNSAAQDTPVTNVAYLASLLNGGGSDINQLTIKYTTKVTSNLTIASIKFTYPGSVCGSPTDDTANKQSTIECSFGDGIRPQALVTAPAVIVATPQFIDGSTADLRANQKITVTVFASFREGKSGTASPSSVSTLTKDIVTSVKELSDTALDSIVIQPGGKFFTGKKGLPNSSDVQATTVVFSPLTSANYSTVAILETPDAPGNSNCIQLGFFKTCYTTLLSAPDVVYTTAGAYMTETILVFKDNLLPGAASKADTLTWYYTPTDAAGVPIFGALRQPIGLCATGPTPRTDGIACQTKPGICYKSSNAPRPELIDVCVWEFINKNNGLVHSYP